MQRPGETGIQQQPPPLQIPAGLPTGLPAQQRSTALARTIAFVNGLTSKAMLLAIVVFALQAAMPEGRRPSDLIGGFHGGTNAAQLDAERRAQEATAAAVANAQAQAQARWQMEQQLAVTQQQARAASLRTQSEMANLADGACVAGSIIGALFGHDADQLAGALKSGCGAGDQFRGNINRSLTDATQQGSGIMQRGSAGAPPR